MSESDNQPNGIEQQTQRFGVQQIGGAHTENGKQSAVWPTITRKKPAPPDADEFVGVPDKFAKYFSPNPGEGD